MFEDQSLMDWHISYASSANRPGEHKRSLSDSGDDASIAKKLAGDNNAGLKTMIEDFYTREYKPEGCISPQEKDRLIEFSTLAVRNVLERLNIKDKIDLASRVDNGFDEIKSLLKKNQIGIPNPTSYAKAASTGVLTAISNTKAAQLKPSPTVTSGRYTILKRAEKKIESEDELRAIKRQLQPKFKQANLRVDMVRKTAQGNLALEYLEEGDQKKVEQFLGANPIPGWEFRSSMEKNIAIALRGVPAFHDDKSLKKELEEFNSNHPFMSHKGWSLIPVTSKSSRRGVQRTKTWKIIAPLDAARTLLNDPRLMIEMQSLAAELWKPGPRRCFRCHSSEHTLKNCTAKPVCKFCTGTHDSQDCREQLKVETHKCIICIKAKQKNVQHCADHRECPLLEQEATQEFEKLRLLVYG